MSRLRRTTVTILVVSLMVLEGCAATQPSRFYVLSSLPSSATKPHSSATKQGPVIGIGPIELPQYLDRPQIVTRASRNQLDLAEFDKWAESLTDNMARVLGENLSILLSTERVLIHPWGATPVEYKVEVRVTTFGGNANGEVSLVAHWGIFGEDGRQVLVARKSSFSEAAGSEDYEAMVSAMSKNLERLSREVASAIKKIPQKEPDRKNHKGSALRKSRT